MCSLDFKLIAKLHSEHVGQFDDVPKKIRNKYVFIAGRVVSHAGSVILRVMKDAYERGLKNLRESWRFSEIMSAQSSLVLQSG